MGRLRYLVIHCTATPRGRTVSSNDIRHWHCDPKPRGRGWRQVGYTDMIHLNGGIERLVNNNEDGEVDPWEITNGARGYNSISRHIVYVGGLDHNGNPMDTRTTSQYNAMKNYVVDFHRRFPEVKIIGHHDLNSDKACPCFSVSRFLREINL